MEVSLPTLCRDAAGRDRTGRLTAKYWPSGIRINAECSLPRLLIPLGDKRSAILDRPALERGAFRLVQPARGVGGAVLGARQGPRPRRRGGWRGRRHGLELAPGACRVVGVEA